MFVGVVPVHDIPQWGVSGWSCKDDTPMHAWEYAESSAKFLGLANGCLCGSGYGVDSHHYDGNIYQPEDGIQNVQYDNDARCTTSFNRGDVVGVLVDCDEQSVQFYRNGEQWGPGYTEGAAPPLAFAVDIFLRGDVTLLPEEPPPCVCCANWDYSWHSVPGLCVECCVAFLMGTHERVGADSAARQLPAGLVEKVVRFAGAASVQLLCGDDDLKRCSQ